MKGQTDIEVVIQRLQRLEREIRWWRIVALLTLLSVATFFFAGGATTVPTVIEAQRFVLRDQNNKVRAMLGTDFPQSYVSSDNVHPLPFEGRPTHPGLRFYGPDGVYQAGISEDEWEGWQLQLNDKKTLSSALLSVGQGVALLKLYATEETQEVARRKDAEWTKKLRAAKTKEEKDRLLFGEKRDYVNIILSAFPKGTSSLGLKHGLGGGIEFVMLDRQSRLELMDQNGTSRVVLGYTQLEYPATGVTEDRPVSSLVLFDKEGKVVWKAP